MTKIYQKTCFIFAVSIFLGVIYHIALLISGNDILTYLFVHIGRVFWIAAEFISFIAGFYCARIFFFDNSDCKKWLEYLLRFLKWIVPSYYLLLLLYLTAGLVLQNYLGNLFVLNSGYIPALLLFYVNFKLAAGPWSGVALEGTYLLSMILQMFFLSGLILILSKCKFIRQKAVIPVFVITLLIVAVYFRIIWHGRNSWFIYFSTITRLDVFLAGLFSAYMYSFDSVKETLKGKKNVLLVAGTIILLIAAVFTTGLSRYNNKIDFVSYPAIAFFSFGLINWIFNTELPAWIDRFPEFNKIVFSVYVIKLPIVYMIKGLFVKNNLSSTPFNNFMFIICCLLSCYIFGIIWHLTVDRFIALILPEERFQAEDIE